MSHPYTPTKPSPVYIRLNNYSEPYAFAGYKGDSIREQNIDGLSGYQIINTIQHMIMFGIITKKGVDNLDPDIAEMIITSFTR